MTSTGDNADIRGDVRAQIREFLMSRRAKITPAQAGVTVYNTERRRVRGLRREEVAMLAGISGEYYIRLERGHATGISDGVVDAIADALRLDDAERDHLVRLVATAARSRPPRRRMPAPVVRKTVQRVLDSMTDAPAYVLNGRLDILAANALGRALYEPLYRDANAVPNTARFTFLDPHAQGFFREIGRVSDDTVGMLRAEVGRNPYDRALSDLIGELCTRSDDFRVRWGAHNVRTHTTAVKLLRHPLVGDLDLPYEMMSLDADSNQNILTFTAEPGSSSHDALTMLASLVATARSTAVGHRASP